MDEFGAKSRAQSPEPVDQTVQSDWPLLQFFSSPLTPTVTRRAVFGR
jgi:hypothetical protein